MYTMPLTATLPQLRDAKMVTEQKTQTVYCDQSSSYDNAMLSTRPTSVTVLELFRAPSVFFFSFLGTSNEPLEALP